MLPSSPRSHIQEQYRQSPPQQHEQHPSPDRTITSSTNTDPDLTPEPLARRGYSCLYTTSSKIIPIALGLHLSISGTIVLIYTLSLHRALPEECVVGITITFGALLAALALAKFSVWLRERLRAGRKVTSHAGTVKCGDGKWSWFWTKTEWIEKRDSWRSRAQVAKENRKRGVESRNDVDVEARPHPPIETGTFVQQARQRMSTHSELEAVNPQTSLNHAKQSAQQQPRAQPQPSQSQAYAQGAHPTPGDGPPNRPPRARFQPDSGLYKTPDYRDSLLVYHPEPDTPGYRPEQPMQPEMTHGQYPFRVVDGRSYETRKQEKPLPQRPDFGLHVGEGNLHVPARGAGGPRRDEPRAPPRDYKPQTYSPDRGEERQYSRQV